MRRASRAAMLLTMLVAAAWAGCVAPDAISPADAAPAGHPYPTGDEWPSGLEGPFALAEVRHEVVPSFDGTPLDGHVYLPALPEGVGAPVVLWSLPYLGQTMPAGDDPRVRDNSGPGEAVPIDLLVEHGYAVAAFSVRGTGNSGGCFEMFGPNEQQDQAFLVEWLAAQAWSNGRVGMMGLSYHGTTPWEAAILDPPSLKTIVVAGMVSDLYTFYHTPQGAALTVGAGFQAAFDGLVTFAPPLLGPPDRATVGHVPVLPERACPEVVRTFSSLAAGMATDQRDAAFWDARRLIDGFPNVTTSVLLTHGFQDLWGSGHQFQESAAWAALDRAPKRMLEGQWAHEFPNFNEYRAEWTMDDWNDRLLAWLDHWLKGVGEAPALGVVEYQDAEGDWRESDAWPPSEARDEVLYLAGGGALSPEPAGPSTTFVSMPDAPGAVVTEESTATHAGPLCAEDGDPRIAVFETAPAEARVVVAGNPFAYLRLTSDAPGGLVSVALVDLAPDFRCEAGVPKGARPWGMGVADLRFHDGGFTGRDFPVGEPTHVRIDITNFAEVLEPGHRLAAFVSYGDVIFRTGQPHFPTVTLHAEDGEASGHLVLPVVEGTLGGAAPTVAYPGRPFVPE